MTFAQTPDPASADAPPRQREEWDVAYDWWRSLQDFLDNGKENYARDRAARARLRRHDVASAATEPAVIALYQRLHARRAASQRWDAHLMTRAIRLALVLAHVREHDPGAYFPRVLGPSAIDADDGALKKLRLRALMKADSEEDVVRHFRRALALIGGRVNARDVARALARWDEATARTRFAFDYFGAGLAAPEQETLD